MKLFLKIIAGIGVILVLLAAFFVFSLRPNVPEDQFDLIPPTSVGGLNVLVFGATGKLGYETARLLTRRGDKVTAFVRPSSDRSQLDGLGVDYAVGDAMNVDSVRAAFAASEFDAVITSIGGMRANPPPDYQGNANIFDAAADAGVKRVIFISTVGAGDSYDAAPLPSRLALAKVIPLKTQAEDHLIASGLDYTIIRPGGLPYGAGTGGGILSEDRATMGFINRPDLARLIVGVLDDSRTIGKTFAAIDPVLKSPWDSGPASDE